MFKSDSIEEILDWPVFGWDEETKSTYFLEAMNVLSEHHRRNCDPYNEIVNKLWTYPETAESLESLPFLPVRLFKHQRLLSVSDAEIVKTMTSSGTSGQSVSQIFLDKQTASLQVKVLSRIMTDFIGPRRAPMLVIDSRATVVDRLRFSARAAGILGFSAFGRKVEFALDDDMSLNETRVKAFIQEFANEPMLIFGFTSIVWRHLVNWLESGGESLSLEHGILIHGGGWKQMLAESVSQPEFKHRVETVTGIRNVHNYYGMVEQAGSIFMECGEGHMHASVWSEVIIRNRLNFEPMPYGASGLIQLLSLVPRSYPGHSLLSEDEGVILGIDNCPCGRKGTFFRVLGRIEHAEKRGCSDTYSP